MNLMTKKLLEERLNVPNNAMPANRNGWKIYCAVCIIMQRISDK